MRTLAAFKDAHKNEKIIVCGCGESLTELTAHEGFVTIGVNDVGRQFHPKYLLVANRQDQFCGDRFSYVNNSKAEYFFTHIPDLVVAHPNVVRFKHGSCNGTDFSNPDVLHYASTSMYMALCLAVHMGGSPIGLIGLDLTDNHFFAKTGPHPLAPSLQTLNDMFQRLDDALRRRGVHVFNLSEASRITAFRRMPMGEFCDKGHPNLGLDSRHAAAKSTA